MDFSEIARVLQVALGIGAVIFVHELGHFIAARLCGVRVEIFSLGFGPRIFGWQRGATVYQLALIPMGGFVKMAGEEAPPGGTHASDELPSKTVGQRFFIYSGGVLMNVLFALLVFPPILFFGVPFPEPLIGAVTPGGPAWRAGIEPGTRVLAVDGEPIISFEDLLTRIGLSHDDDVELTVRAPGAATDTQVHVQPSFGELRGIRTIDVSLAADPDGELRIAAASAAFEAGLRDGDRLVDAEGIGQDASARVLFRMRRGEPLQLEVERDGKPLEFTVAPRTTAVATKKAALFLSAEAATCRVADLRAGPAAEHLDLQVDDRILLFEGQPILREGDFALALSAALGRPFELLVERDRREVLLSVAPMDAGLVRAALLDVALVADVEGTRAAVIPGGAAAKAGLENGDRLMRIGNRPTQRWADVPLALKSEASEGAVVVVNVERRAADGTRRFLDFEVRPGPLLQPEYGLLPHSATYVYRAETFGEAVKIGVSSSVQIMADIWHFLGGIFRGSVSSDNLGGIIAISQGSYMFASVGLTKLIFFLCMLSLNLAFINVLPIPVLDGGHLFFLLIEKIKGSPVNERVLGYSQMVGLVLILGLVVFVTYNDLRRLFVE